MKRDMDLVRELLLQMEEHEHGRAPRTFEVEGHSEDEIGYHILIMAEAGLIVAIPIETMGQNSPAAIPIRLTWAGHDFLDASRDDERWKKARGIFVKVGGVTFDVAKAVLTSIATDQAMALL